MSKLSHKICCSFNKDVKCILLVKRHNQCVFEETTEKQQERGEQQLGACALLPESEREAFWRRSERKGFLILEAGKIRRVVLWAGMLAVTALLLSVAFYHS